jgi:riboflavin kinase/FMN adenylyltransferase
METQYGYRTVVIDPVEITLADLSRVRASSSMIRWLLTHGRITDANRILGRPHHLTAHVHQGEQRGRRLNIPTANIDHEDVMLPADGIYAGMGIMDNNESYPAAISIGRKPTFNGTQRVCEAHLIGYDGPLDDYGWTLHLHFHTWIREQYAFPNTDALVDQIHRDIETTRQFFIVHETSKHV